MAVFLLPVSCQQENVQTSVLDFDNRTDAKTPEHEKNFLYKKVL